jgi:glycosyltransferase involved in cell wall biosynthesis
VVAGYAPDPDYGDNLRQCERTLCLGRASARELAAMIRAADLVVMPNIATPDEIDVEGFGLAAVEAAALGGRLLAASIDGITDAVADGITGRLLPSGEAMAWVDAIQSAFSKPLSETERNQISSSAMTIFSRDRQLDHFLKIFSTAQ